MPARLTRLHKRKAAYAVVFTLCAALVGCGVIGAFWAPMTAHGAWLRYADPQAGVAAGYVQLVNRQVVDDRLLNASSPQTTDIVVRETIDDGRATRVLDPGPVVARKNRLELAPGGLHLSLRGVSLRAGERIPVTLHFQHAGNVEVSFVARPLAPHLPASSGADLVR